MGLGPPVGARREPGRGSPRRNALDTLALDHLDALDGMVVASLDLTNKRDGRDPAQAASCPNL
jgi:hypothetical protein